MAMTLTLRHERVDDISLIIGLASQLRLAEILDHHLGTHGLQEGLNNGQVVVGWLAYILSRADHRKSAVREWRIKLENPLQAAAYAQLAETYVVRGSYCTYLD